MIFPREKLIFVPILKTGTLSVRTWLRQFMVEGFKTTHDHIEEFGHPDHPTLFQCHQKLLANGENPHEYRSFSFIRNPWAHLYSVWAYQSRSENTDLDWNGWMALLSVDYEKIDLWKTHRFKGFLDRLESPYRNVDYIGTLEKFDDHIATLKNLILDKHIENHYNVLLKNWPNLYQGPTPKRLLYPDHINISVKNKEEYLTKYTDAQIKIVSELYARDIERFALKFESK